MGSMFSSSSQAPQVQEEPPPPRSKYNTSFTSDLELHRAARDNAVESVEEILRKDPKRDLNAIDRTYATALHRACEKGRLQMVILLVGKGASIHLVNNGLKTPLHVACRHGHTDVCIFLLDRGADPYAKDNENKTPLGLLDKHFQMHHQYTHMCTPTFTLTDAFVCK